VVVDAAPEPAAEPPQERAAVARQSLAQLDRILDQLDDAKRAVFVLYEIEQLTMAEVAAAMGCPLQTAYSRLHAARAEVRAAVARLRLEGGAP
jgi:RNA polymerase sigma-70 factor (ECF subfamily)